mmetsp:Transcript_5908/g.12067  ORF Transcript_5908/g.12067 Transcript_5908/m.12067 type:complete len:89 (+) Transcript_5908:81-347(+)
MEIQSLAEEECRRATEALKSRTGPARLASASEQLHDRGRRGRGHGLGLGQIACCLDSAFSYHVRAKLSLGGEARKTFVRVIDRWIGRS